jgi:hypothetical protein
MKLSYVEAETFGARPVEADDKYGYEMADGKALILPAKFNVTAEDADHDGFANLSERGMGLALTSVLQITHKHHTVLRNEKLSQLGRDAELSNPKQTAVQAIGVSWRFTEEHQAALDTEEQNFYRSPTLEKEDHGEKGNDVYICTQFRGLAPAKKTAFFERALKSDDPKVIRQIQALLRDPGDFDDDQSDDDNPVNKILKPAWRARQDRVDPKRAAALRAGRADLDAARQNILQCAAHVRALAGFKPLDLYRVIRPTNGSRVFFSPQAAAELDYQLSHDIHRPARRTA